MYVINADNAAVMLNVVSMAHLSRTAEMKNRPKKNYPSDRVDIIISYSADENVFSSLSLFFWP